MDKFFSSYYKIKKMNNIYTAAHNDEGLPMWEHSANNIICKNSNK